MEMEQKYFPKLKNIRFERAMRRVQQHFRRNVTAIVIRMVKAIPEEGEAGHKALIRSTVLRKPNRKVEVNYIIANRENCMVSNI